MTRMGTYHSIKNKMNHLRNAYSDVWGLSQKLRPSMKTIANENNLYVHGILDRSNLEVDSMLKEKVNQYRGPYSCFRFFTDEEGPAIEVEYDCCETTKISHISYGHEGDVVTIHAVNDDRSMYQKNIKIPREFFDKLPKNLKNRRGTKLIVKDGIDLSNFKQWDLSPFQYLYLETNWDEDKMEEMEDYLKANYEDINYIIGNLDKNLYKMNYNYQIFLG